MIYDILQQKLEAAGLTVGTDLFIEFVPAAINIAVMLRTPLGGVRVNPHMPNRYRGEIQVIVRHTDPVAGKRQADRMQKLLTVQSRQTFPETAERGEAHLDLCFPQTLPVRYPRLDGNTIEWSQVFDIVWGVKDLG